MSPSPEISMPTPAVTMQATDNTSSSPVENHEANLAASSGLATVDSATLKQAIRDNTSANASDNLPAMTMPLSMDKDVVRSHDDLAKLADKAFSTPADKQKFSSNMNAFEQRAEAQGLTPAQVNETYVNVASMLKPAASSPLTTAERTEVVGQLMSNLADPEGTTKQGWHDTCAWTSLEIKLTSVEPEKITGTLAQVILSGGVTTVDGAALDKMPAGTTDLPMKILKLDAASLQPDLESQGKAVSSDGRSYVDQIAQVTLANISWDTRAMTPDGKHVQAGTMQYEQLERVSRPTDIPEGGAPDTSGEQVVYTDPKSGLKTIYDDHGYGTGGAATTSEISYVEAIVSGKDHMDKLALSRPVEGYQNDPFDVEINSPAALKSTLEDLQKNHQFPMSTKVEAANPAIVNDVIKRHPNLTPEQVPDNLWHSVMITGLNQDGTVDVYNPWGIKREWTQAELYQAMGKPEHK